MTRAEELLQQYRVLEELLSKRYANKKIQHDSVVLEFQSEKIASPFRNELDMIRKIRNVLTHSADYDGGYTVEPSEDVLITLNEIIKFVRHPIRLKDIMTPMHSLLFVQKNNRVIPLLRVMEQRGYSHIPVLDNGELFGVFSRGVLASYLCHIGNVTETTTLGDMAELLPIDKHICERYLYMASDASLADVQKAFSSRKPGEPRLALVIVTQNGSATGKFLGIASAYDALKPISRGIYP